MDLGIAGKTALVCASSKGLGRGCAEALAEAGCNLVMNARGAETLEQTLLTLLHQLVNLGDLRILGALATVSAAATARGPASALIATAAPGAAAVSCH